MVLPFIIIGFVGFELFGWIFHKYVMHGVLWSIHKTHHHKNETFLELNDCFSVIFGSIAMVLIDTYIDNFQPGFWIGVGIGLYGFVFFILHDVLIHRRIRHKYKLKNKLFVALREAHQAHHKHNQKEDAVSFGLLLIHPKYFKEKSERD
ncbi:sterol desaturase family protein [Calothrix sp. CCY 0018]|uniref:sterol desaturase family protein n=1 Tax=Calothrix sp. CCY 0018 TaxID=3103864 RepID=UPI0039C65313